MENCGLVALNGIAKIKNASMFTLLHLAKDNGTEMFFCKVEVKDLMKVARPAILHANNHFILAEDNKPLEEAKYTGWVLTPKPIGVPLPYSLAKQITGGKKGGDILGPIVTGIGIMAGNALLPGVGGSLAGAALGGAFAAHKVSGGAGVTPAKGEFWRIPVGIATGYLGGQAPNATTFGLDNALLAGGLSAAAELPGAIKSGNYMSPVLAGLGGYAGQKFTSGASAGFNQATGGLGAKIGGAIKGGLGNILPQGGTGSTGALTPNTPAMSMKTGGVGNVMGQQLPGTGNILPMAAGGLKTSIPNVMGSTSGGGGWLDTIFGGGKGDLLKLGIAGIGSQIGKPEEYKPDSMASYDKASQFLGGKTLPPATSQQLNRWLTMPIADIKSELLNPAASNRAMLEIDKKYQEALTQVQRAAANAGQSIETSSDARRTYDEVNRQWAEAKANLQNELDQQATQQAIGIHQWALQQSIAQGQFDTNSAMELAAMMGRDQELKAAIEQQNYEAFQNIIGEILGSNFQGGSSQQTNRLTSVLGGA